MFKKISSKVLSSLPQIVALLFILAFAAFAWQEPSQAPPGGNVPTPLNVGLEGQTKEGWLATLKSFFIGSGPTDAEKATVGVLRTTGGAILNTGNATFGLIVDKGKVGFGTTNPGKTLEVVGDIKLSGQIFGLRAENVSGLPVAGSAGRIVFNTGDSKLYFDNGTSWKPILSLATLAGPLYAYPYGREEEPGSDRITIPAEAQKVICYGPTITSSYWSGYPCTIGYLLYKGEAKIAISSSTSTNMAWYGGGGVWDGAGGGEVTFKSPTCGAWSGNAVCYYTKLE